ncbi:MAG: hypothetical protein ACOCYU_04355 [Brevefilum sp.]
MPRNDKQVLDKAKEANEGFFRSLYDDLRLIARLLKDRRVNFLLKLLPIGALFYLFFPLDIFPVNPLDDGLVMWLGGYFFIELCSDDVVEEHRKALRNPVSKEHSMEDNPSDVVEGSFRDLSDEEKQ